MESYFFKNSYININWLFNKKVFSKNIKKFMLYLNFFESANYYIFLFFRSINKQLKRNIILGDNLNYNECNNILYCYNLYTFLKQPIFFFESTKYKRIYSLKRKHLTKNWLDYRTSTIQNNKNWLGCCIVFH